MNQTDRALWYADAGVRIFPCDSKDKSPLTKKGFLDASTDPKKIARWWKKHPDALIGCHCDDQATVLDFDYDKGISVVGWKSILESFYGITSEFQITTKSHGHHLYFKPSPDVSRRLGLIRKGIDVLGAGGYAVLPDQQTYHVDDIDAFAAALGTGNLPEIPQLLIDLCNTTTNDIASAFNKTGIKCPNLDNFIRNDRKERLDDNFRTTKNAREESRFTREEKEEKAQSRIEKDKQIYDRTAGTSDGYAKTEIEFERDAAGSFVIPRGTLKAGDVNKLFYNKENQEKMAAFMGVPLPTTIKRRKFRSLIYGHSDVKPSMGSRWAESGNHIIIRDFSNFFADCDSRVDYNLVRLFMQNQYSMSAGKPVSIKSVSSPEFCVWSLRLMYEAGVVSFERTQLHVDRLTDSELKVKDGYTFLHDIKSLYENYDGQTVFAKRFASAWSNVKPTSVLRAMWKLKKDGIMVESGKYGEGKYASTLFSLGDLNIEEQDTRSVDEMPVKDEMSVGILFGAEIDSSYKETIKNFCEDFEIENVIEDKYMAIVIGTVDSNEEVKPVLPAPLLISDFVLYTVDHDKGSQALMASFESNVIQELHKKLLVEYELQEEEPELSFVISTDYEGPDDDEHMDELTYQFNQYFPMIEASQEITGYYSPTEIDMFVFGSIPEKKE